MNRALSSLCRGGRAVRPQRLRRKRHPAAPAALLLRYLHVLVGGLLVPPQPRHPLVMMMGGRVRIVRRALGIEDGVEGQDLVHAVAAQLVERRLEVVEDDGVGEALEDEGELPEGVDDAEGDDGGDGEDVDDDEDEAEGHAQEQDAEARGRADDVDEAQVVAVADVVQQVGDSEDPPGVAARSVSMMRRIGWYR